MSEQLEYSNDAHDRIDLLQLRVKDLEELAKTQTKLLKISTDALHIQTSNITKINTVLVQLSKIIN